MYDMADALTGLGVLCVALGMVYLIGATIWEYTKKKKRPPQDHYYAERKKEKDN